MTFKHFDIRKIDKKRKTLYTTHIYSFFNKFLDIKKKTKKKTKVKRDNREGLSYDMNNNLRDLISTLVTLIMIQKPGKTHKINK